MLSNNQKTANSKVFSYICFAKLNENYMRYFINTKRRQSDIDKSPDKLTKRELDNLQIEAGKKAQDEYEKALKKAKISFKKR